MEMRQPRAGYLCGKTEGMVEDQIDFFKPSFSVAFSLFFADPSDKI